MGVGSEAFGTSWAANTRLDVARTAVVLIGRLRVIGQDVGVTPCFDLIVVFKQILKIWWALRWTAAAMAFKQLPALRAALAAHYEKETNNYAVARKAKAA